MAKTSSLKTGVGKASIKPNSKTIGAILVSVLGPLRLGTGTYLTMLGSQMIVSIVLLLFLKGVHG